MNKSRSIPHYISKINTTHLEHAFACVLDARDVFLFHDSLIRILHTTLLNKTTTYSHTTLLNAKHTTFF